MNDRLQRLLADANALPLGNQAALGRVASLCVDPGVDARTVAAEAALDESFAALLLRLANSAYSASTSRVGELPGAIARLGFRLVGGLAVAAPAMRLLVGPADDLAPARRSLHRHAVRTGLAARELASGPIDPEAALTAGLLHNLGLAVLSLHERVAARLLLEVGATGLQLGPAESRLLGFTHAELGARLAEQWSYPAELVTAIAEHDEAAPSSRLGALVHVADRLVRARGLGIEPRTEPSNRAFAVAQIDPVHASVVMAGLFEECAVFGPRDGDGEDDPRSSRSIARTLDALV